MVGDWFHGIEMEIRNRRLLRSDRKVPAGLPPAMEPQVEELPRVSALHLVGASPLGKAQDRKSVV